MHCVLQAYSWHCQFRVDNSMPTVFIWVSFSLLFYLLTKTQDKHFDCLQLFRGRYISPPPTLLAEIKREFLKKQKVESLQIQDSESATVRHHSKSEMCVTQHACRQPGLPCSFCKPTCKDCTRVNFCPSARKKNKKESPEEAMIFASAEALSAWLAN